MLLNLERSLSRKWTAWWKEGLSNELCFDDSNSNANHHAWWWNKCEGERVGIKTNSKTKNEQQTCQDIHQLPSKQLTSLITSRYGSSLYQYGEKRSILMNIDSTALKMEDGWRAIRRWRNRLMRVSVKLNESITSLHHWLVESGLIDNSHPQWKEWERHFCDNVLSLFVRYEHNHCIYILVKGIWACALIFPISKSVIVSLKRAKINIPFFLCQMPSPPKFEAQTKQDNKRKPNNQCTRTRTRTHTHAHWIIMGPADPTKS